MHRGFIGKDFVTYPAYFLILEFRLGLPDYEIDSTPQPHEANYLKLDCSKAKALLGWYPRWNIDVALKMIVNWNKAFIKGVEIQNVCYQQIDEYFKIKRY